jgi:hypothetical protein
MVLSSSDGSVATPVVVIVILMVMITPAAVAAQRLDDAGREREQDKERKDEPTGHDNLRRVVGRADGSGRQGCEEVSLGRRGGSG